MVIALTILKILGILLLIAAVILVLVLFFPVRYVIDGDIDQKRFEAKVTWMFRLVWFRFTYHEKMESVLSIFFFKLDFTDQEKKAAREKKKVEKARRKALRVRKKRKRRHKSRNRIPDAAHEDVLHKSVSQEGSATASAEEEEKTAGTIGKATGAAQKAIKILKLVSKYDVLTIAGPLLITFLKHIRPRYLRGQVKYGLEDPANTGYITGGLAAIPFLYEFELILYPDFEANENYIKGAISSGGHLLLIHAVILMIRLFRQKDIRKFIGAIRKVNK